MKKYLLRLIAGVSLLLFALCPISTKATSLAAGEVIYEWISDSTYRVLFKGYFDCSGIPEPSSMPLCITNSCNSSILNATMSLFGSSIVPPDCPSYPTKCTLPSSSLPGYKIVTYSTFITLPYRCNSWKFAVIYSSRPATANLVGSNFYAEATFNNTGSFQGNSSPYFNNLPVQKLCNGGPYAYNSNAVDPNGDSLSTSIIAVRTNSTCGSTPTTVTLASTSPALSIPNNPFQTNNTTTINSTTGQMSLTPGVLGEQVAAVEVKEYRGGVLIGTVIRELRFGVLSCSSSPTINFSTPFALVNCILGTGGSIQACAGQTIGFSFDIKSSDTSSILIVSSNPLSTPGATVTYNNQAQDSVRVTYSWPVPTTTVGMFTVIFSIKDSTCKAPGIITHTSISRLINIYMGARKSNLSVCLGNSITLSGGNNWSILSGTPGSLSCTACPSPVATPTATSTYIVTNTICPNLTDTHVVNVITAIPTPTISIAANPGTTITAGSSVTFTATTAGCNLKSISWRRNGLSTGSGGPTFITSALANGDVITAVFTCNDSCASPKTQTSNALTMNVTTGIQSGYARTVTNIYPNPNTGSFTVSGETDNNDAVTIKIFNSIGHEVFEKVLQPENRRITTSFDLNLPNGMYYLKAGNSISRFTITK